MINNHEIVVPLLHPGRIVILDLKREEKDFIRLLNFDLEKEVGCESS